MFVGNSLFRRFFFNGIFRTFRPKLVRALSASITVYPSSDFNKSDNFFSAFNHRSYPSTPYRAWHNFDVIYQSELNLKSQLSLHGVSTAPPGNSGREEGRRTTPIPTVIWFLYYGIRLCWCSEKNITGRQIENDSKLFISFFPRFFRDERLKNNFQ